MTANINTFAQGVIQYAFWARKDTTGVYPYGQTGTLANAADAGLSRYVATATFVPTIPNRTVTPIIGDGGNKGTIFSRATENTTAVITFNAVDQNFMAQIAGLSVFADGDHDAIALTNQCLEFKDLFMVYNMSATSLETATADQDKWLVFELYNVEGETNFNGYSGTAFDPVPINFNLDLEEVSTHAWGATVSSSNYGVDKMWGRLYWSENPVVYHTHVGDGADTTLTLDYTPAANSAAKVKAWQDGVEITYTTNYSVSGTAFTFVVAPGAGVVTVIRYEFTDVC